jgi:hypothetical protein
MESDYCQQVAEKIVRLIAPFGIVNEAYIPIIALAILENMPGFETMSQADVQFNFDRLVGAIAAMQTAIPTARTARFLA